ncbi:hypothetical protein GIB67_035629 [Kingdonia uniflora]|uniref:Uncharacterized protein n=1 Tax=Kingdonia uniflora TaxID=39325 RepID=A0A7J7LKM8_9MAGN|nr:hypothetical protein GIB67_035629 [Kingdonia uniflora]
MEESADPIPQDELLLTELLPKECSGKRCGNKLKNTQGNAIHVNVMETNSMPVRCTGRSSDGYPI